MRLLPAVRLSLADDDSTSPERQMQRMQQYAQLHDHTLVPTEEADWDIGVSGGTPPWDRPGLGPWLAEDRLSMWDGLIVAKLDRLTRSLLDFEQLVRWLQERGKVLVCLDPAIDLSTPAGIAFAQVIVVFAEFERATIRQRTREAYQALLKARRYRGGQLGFGYMPVRLERGWGVQPDPEYAPVVAEMAARYAGYESFGSIAKWLNDSGVPSPMDAMRKRNGQELRGTKWKAAVVRIVLKGPGILGAAVDTEGEVVRDDDGEVIYMAAPLVDRETWEKVQARISENPRGAKTNTTALLRVVFCTCGSVMYATTTRKTEKGRTWTYRHYRCHARRGYDRTPTCDAPRIAAERLEEAVFGELLGFAGDAELMEKRMIHGRDFAEQIAKVKDRLSHLAGEIEMGEALGDDVTELVSKRDQARAELRRLVSLEQVPARIEDVPTGKKFRAHWESLSTIQKNEFLRSAGIVVTAHKTKMPKLDFASRPVGQRTMAVIDEDGCKAVIRFGNLGELLRRAEGASQ